MKLKSLMLIGALTSLSCANAPNEFRISKFYPLGSGCSDEFRENVIVGNGYLDVAAGNPTVIVGVEITGAEKIQQPEVIVGGSVLENEDRNRPIVTTMEVNYRLSKRVGGTPRPYIQNISLPFSDDGEIFGGIQLLSPELGQALFDGLSPSPGTAPSNTIEDFVDIHFDVQFRGEFSRTRHPFTTGVLSLPVRAYRSNPVACPDGAGGTFPYVKYGLDPVSGLPDICGYVGFTPQQIANPGTPACCAGRGPTFGPGC